MKTLICALVLAMLGTFVPAMPVVAQTFNLGPPLGVPPPGAPPPGAGSRAGITATNPVPVLVSISPTQVAAGGPNTTLTLSGNGFSAKTIVAIGGLSVSPSASSATTMTVTIPAALLIAGTLPISVMNPAPGGGTSAALAFTVSVPALPAPHVSSIVPSSLTVGSPSATVTLTGTGFVAGKTSIALGALAGAIASATSATINIPSSMLANAGTLNILVSNPSPGGGSAAAQVNVLNGVPTLTSVSPKSVMAGSPAVSLAVTGTGLLPATEITLGGTPLPTVFRSATSAAATIPASFLQRAGTFPIGATNPKPGGGATTSSSVLTVSNPAPRLAAVSPTRVFRGTLNIDVMLTGTGFTGTSAVYIGTQMLAAVFNSATSITASIPASLLSKAADLRITVVNPNPGGGTSASVTVLVGN
jgi:hypothetical protein